MSSNEAALWEFGQNIQKLIEKEDLSRDASYGMFCQLMKNNQPDLHQGAFLSALAAKGETIEEIVGAWQAIVELDTCPLDMQMDHPLVENSGTGMDALKTFNVSSAAAVVAAAGGIKLARHGARALTSVCGTVDLLDALGINVECSVEQVGRSIQETGIGLFNGMSPQIHPNALFRILSQIRFGSILNIAASLASPCRPTHGLRGVFAEPVIGKVSQIMRAIGYQRAMVVHGYDHNGQKGMDEISTLGETAVEEFFPDGRQAFYRITPEDLGLHRTTYESIAAQGDVEKEAVRFMRVVSGVDHRESIDLVCANAGAIMYVAGRADDLPTGVAVSRELIDSGRAFEKLCQWITVQSDPEQRGITKFKQIAERAGLKDEVNQF